ncbi:hypothetical protein TNCV_1526891 [Trichonephila clavipes]|nr:hypothetical protein TNCV_1526891 [Trichonephila clavipes]
MSPGSVYSIKRVAFVFGDIVVNAHSSSSYWLKPFYDTMGTIGCDFLIRIDGTLNRACYISGVFQAIPCSTPVACIMRTFFDMETVYPSLSVHQISPQ